MRTRALLLLGVVAAFASAAAGEVRVKIEGGKHVIYNDGPAKIRASEAVQRAYLGESYVDEPQVQASNEVPPK